MIQPTPPVTPAAHPAVLAEALEKRFGDFHAVRGINLSIPYGQCFGLLGPNGAGKTTVLRMLLGRIPHSAGRLEIFGRNVAAQAAEIRRRIGVVPQIDNLDPDFSVSENLAVYGRFFALSKAELAGRIPELLRFVELDARAQQPITALSGGMQRRLTLARALINDPELVVLDEPTTGLDPQVRHLLWARLRDLLKTGKTLILTSHYMEEAERLCDALVVMDQGRILDEGSPQALIRRNVEAEVVEIRQRLPEAARQALSPLAERLDTVGETTLIYCSDARPALNYLEQHHGLGYLHRPANLEDVFLRLTGHDLRE